jgi:hypothetical protein
MEGNLILFEITGQPLNPRTCEEGLQGRMSVDASSLHPQSGGRLKLRCFRRFQTWKQN